MTRIELIGNCRKGRLAVTHTRGDPLTVTFRVDGDRSAANLALVEALDGVDCGAQIRATPDGSVVAEMTVTVSRVGNVLNGAAVLTDSEALEAGDTYVFDVEPAGMGTLFSGSTIYVEPDVTRETGS